MAYASPRHPLGHADYIAGILGTLRSYKQAHLAPLVCVRVAVPVCDGLRVRVLVCDAVRVRVSVDAAVAEVDDDDVCEADGEDELEDVGVWDSVMDAVGVSVELNVCTNRADNVA